MAFQHESFHLAPRGLALARPLPFVPRPFPRAAPPLVPVAMLPTPRLLKPELDRDVDVGAVNFDEAREEFGRLDTYEVSAVL